MLAGVKFVPRDQIHKDESPDTSSKQRKKSSSKEEQHRRKKKSPKYSSSDEDMGKIRRGSKKKKWYSLEDVSSENESGSSSPEEDEKHEKHQSRKKSKSRNDSRSRDETTDRSKKRPRSGKEKPVSDDHSSSSSYGGSDTYSGKKEGHRKGSRKDGRKKNKKSSRGNISESDLADGKGGDLEIARKEIGLEWMLRPEARVNKPPAIAIENKPKETLTEEVPKTNSKELNPYFNDNGTGYPEDKDEPNAGVDKLLSSSVVGDGGASWRLKALKRAKEQAARDGRKLDEVVEERWGSLGQLAVSVASRTAAPSRAHLRAINSRKRGLTEENQSERDVEKRTSRDYLKDVSLRLPKMREPKVSDSLSWGRRRNQNVPAKDDGLISDAFSTLNKFSDDGSFMHEALRQKTSDCSGPAGDNSESEVITSEANRHRETSTGANDGLSANQLAAKAFQLRMKGKHEEAEKLLQEVENVKAVQVQGSSGDSRRPQKEGSSSRFATRDTFVRQKKNADDADLHLAHKIMQNKKYSISGQADDEYDFDDGPSKKSRKKQGNSDEKVTQKNTVANRFSTQKERCVFCFENPRRPVHLVVAIANFSYLMLPQHEPLVPGHCCILPMEHVPATRIVDEDVWEEIRNFKKCLIMMFAEQEKDVVFLETVMGLAQQRRHCLVECIPLPRDVANEAPLYFKKAIDEAEDEWSQHNAKRLIDTSVKGLRGSVPENFPYFHVEFGLYKGFVHVIDDEKQFKSNLGLNVIRGMLQLAEEDMYRRQRYESVEVQKQAVKSFARDWARFDWTKQLDQAS